jgi:hypothetical protein
MYKLNTQVYKVIGMGEEKDRPMSRHIMLSLPVNINEKLEEMVRKGYGIRRQHIIISILSKELLKNEENH